MAKTDLSPINVVAELERCGWPFEFAGEDEVRCRCPFHEDEMPSCSVNVEKKLFQCQAAGCRKKGDFLTFLAGALKTQRRVVWEELSQRYDFDAEVKVINPATVERYHQALWGAKPMLKELRLRGITEDMLRRHRIGYHNGRVTIPVSNTSGVIVNVRRYLPGAPGPDKMRNTRGHGKVRLYPVEQLSYDTVVVCGGELKAVVSAHHLNPHKIGAVTATAGEGNWEHDFSKRLREKRIYVCFDVDDAGSVGADKVCARVKGDASWVGKVELPLDRDKYPHGDVNDWFGREKATAEMFLALLESTKEWEPVVAATYRDDEPAVDVHLASAVKAEYTARRVRVKAVISAMDTAPYVIPSKVQTSCTRNQDGCSACPVFAATPDEHGFVSLDISPESPGVIEMVAAPKKAQREAIMASLGVPGCKTAEFRPVEYFNVEDVRLSPQLEISERQADHIMQPALCVGHGLELNESYQLAGRMFPHPKTQQSVLLISTYVATQDALSNYAPTVDQLGELAVFQPAEWTVEGMQAKLDELYDDLEANVTRIFQRRDLHVAIDLVYHSVLLLNFDRRVVKGWAEALVLGDSSQGKTETTTQLMRHYGLGERVECKNATVAGLLGGLQQMGTRWFVTWGVIPTHDKRLVVLEELKGASPEVIAKLTDMRSSGIAEIPKIEKRRTHARTRLIALSNPRSDSPLSTYSFGVEAARELVGGLEDIRRFDLVLLVSADEIDAAALNELMRSRPKVKHRHTSELCRRCVLWAWTREPEQVEITEKAFAASLDESTRLCNKFSEVIPIVDRGSMRFKLARLAAALACRTFSCGKNPEVVVVRNCHVLYVSQLLDRVYSGRVSGYLDFSNAVQAQGTLLNPNKVKAHVLQVPYPSDFVEQMLHTNEIELRDICDWCGWDKGDGLQLLSYLVRKHALVRDGRGYRKTPPFIELLKALKLSPEMKVLDRPEFLEEEF